jgi:type 1 fimbriae regulatory protein FimB
MEPETDALFVSERRGPLNRKTAWLAIRNYGKWAGLSLITHPHRLRQTCGFVLVYQGADTRLIQDYLDHSNIQHTVICAKANPARFERLWR